MNFYFPEEGDESNLMHKRCERPRACHTQTYANKMCVHTNVHDTRAVVPVQQEKKVNRAMDDGNWFLCSLLRCFLWGREEFKLEGKRQTASPREPLWANEIVAAWVRATRDGGIYIYFVHFVKGLRVDM